MVKKVKVLSQRGTRICDVGETENGRIILTFKTKEKFEDIYLDEFVKRASKAVDEQQGYKKKLSHLSEKQLRRLKLYADGKTYREIANIENTTPSVIFESISSAKKKFLKFF